MQSLAVQILSQLLLAVSAAGPAIAAPAARPAPDLPAQGGRAADRQTAPAAAAPRQPVAVATPQKAVLPPAPQKPTNRAAAQPAGKQAGHDYRTAVAQYERLSDAERKQYVQRLIAGRLQAAAQLTLDDAALAREKEIDEEILARLDEGQTISPRGLVKILRKLDALEHAAVESLARSYRVEVYSLFHSQRREYDAHIAAWKKIEAAWEASGKVPDEQRALFDWLRAATDRIRADRHAQLPPAPKFGRAAAPQVARSQPMAPRLADLRPAPEPARQPPLEPAPASAGQRASSSQLPKLEHVAPHVPAGRVPALESPLAAARSGQTSVAQIDPPRTSEPQPLKKQSPEVRIALKPVQRPAEPISAARTAQADSLQPQAGRIDLDELSVRIAGHNLALARLAGRLQDHGLWTLERLNAALADLEDLTARRGDLLLYWDLIGEQERSTVGALHSPAATITMLGAKITAARIAAVGHHGDPADGTHDENAAPFDSLSRRLAQLVGAGANR